MASANEIFGPYATGKKNPDGTWEYVFADPFRVRRLLDSLLPGDEANRIVGQWPNGDCERLVATVRQVFGLLPFDPATGTGATEEAVIEIWDAWQGWCQKKNPTPGTMPTSTTVSPAPTLPAWARESVSAS